MIDEGLAIALRQAGSGPRSKGGPNCERFEGRVRMGADPSLNGLELTKRTDKLMEAGSRRLSRMSSGGRTCYVA